jgi:hypothetical protein
MQANSPTSKLSAKIALVIGGTSGIGLATQKIRRVVFTVQKDWTWQRRRGTYGATTSQAAIGSRQTSENELKVRAIDVGESLKSPLNRIDKAV